MARKFRVKYGDEVRNFSNPEGHKLAQMVLQRRLARERGRLLDSTRILPHNREDCPCGECEKWRISRINPLTDLRGASRAPEVPISRKNLRLPRVCNPSEFYSGRWPLQPKRS